MREGVAGIWIFVIGRLVAWLVEHLEGKAGKGKGGGLGTVITYRRVKSLLGRRVVCGGGGGAEMERGFMDWKLVNRYDSSIVGGGGVSLDVMLGSERASISGWVWRVRIGCGVM